MLHVRLKKGEMPRVGPVRSGSGARERVGSGPGSGPGSVGSPLEELSCMFCVSLMHLWSLMWTPLDTVFLGRLGPSLEPIILQRLEGKAWRKGYVREVPSILGRLSNFLKTIDFEVFDRHKLENHCFEKQAPGSIPPGSPFMACLDVFGPIPFVMVFLHDRFPLSLNGAASNEAMEPSREE